MIKAENENNERPHGYLNTVLHHRCPRCRVGYMFRKKNPYRLKSFMQMNEKCIVCGQRTEIEAGFYYGTGYVSYILAVAFSAATLVAWWVLIGLSADDNRIFWWLIANSIVLLLLQPYFMRLSRSVWLAIFVHYDSAWSADVSQAGKGSGTAKSLLPD